MDCTPLYEGLGIPIERAEELHLKIITTYRRAVMENLNIAQMIIEMAEGFGRPDLVPLLTEAVSVGYIAAHDRDKLIDFAQKELYFKTLEERVVKHPAAAVDPYDQDSPGGYG